MRILWGVVCVFAVLWFLGIGLSLAQLGVLAIAVYAVGNTGMVPS